MKNINAIKAYLLSLQDSLCNALQHCENTKEFHEDCWTHEKVGGGRTRVLEKGSVFERAGVNFSHVSGDSLPPAATQKDQN